jgi:transcriptional regulator with XRE-family HTH domain
MTTRLSPAGSMLRDWRCRRRHSQLDLATRAEVSAKHLSYVETGRAKPSPEMILHLCQHLDVPLRERNAILLAAGYAPHYSDVSLDIATSVDQRDANELRPLVDLVISEHRFPTIVVDAQWNLVAANSAVALLMEHVAAELLAPPTNVIRLSLRSDGLAPHIMNFTDYATHIINRLRRTIDHQPDATLQALLDEFGHLASPQPEQHPGVLLPLELRTSRGVIRMFSTITSFGSPHDVTLAELAIETFYPADDQSRSLLAL